MTALVASLVILLVVIFLEVPLLGVVSVMREIIVTVAHTLLVVLVFRVILFVLLLWRRRRHPRRSSGNTNTQSHHPNPQTLLQIHSHKASISPPGLPCAVTPQWTWPPYSIKSNTIMTVVRTRVCPVVNSRSAVFGPTESHRRLLHHLNRRDLLAYWGSERTSSDRSAGLDCWVRLEGSECLGPPAGFGLLGPLGGFGLLGPLGGFGLLGPLGGFGLLGPLGGLGLFGPLGGFGLFGPLGGFGLFGPLGGVGLLGPP